MKLLSKFNQDEKLKNEQTKMDEILFILDTLNYLNKDIQVRYLFDGRIIESKFKSIHIHSFYKMWKHTNMKGYPLEISKFTKYLIDCEQGKTIEPFYIGKHIFNEKIETFLSFIGAMRLVELEK